MQSSGQVDADHPIDVFDELASREVLKTIKHEERVPVAPVSFPVAAVTGPAAMKLPVATLKVPVTLTVKIASLVAALP